MYIKCWGARGSSPVSGSQFIKYGGNTACLEVRTSDPEQVVMLDIGTGALPMGLNLVRQNILHLDVLITHTHWDHIMGFPLFPLHFIPGARLRFYYNPGKQGNPKKLLLRDMLKPPHFPVNTRDLPAAMEFIEVGSEFSIGQMKVKSIPLSHPNLGLGYRLESEGKSFVFLTDNELGFRHRGGASAAEYEQFCRGADLLIHDSEYIEQDEYREARGYGHSQTDDVLDMAGKARVKALGLFHHNRERTDDHIDLFMDKLKVYCSRHYSFQVFAAAQEQEIIL